jgi:hypothetical protein
MAKRIPIALLGAALWTLPALVSAEEPAGSEADEHGVVPTRVIPDEAVDSGLAGAGLDRDEDRIARRHLQLLNVLEEAVADNDPLRRADARTALGTFLMRLGRTAESAEHFHAGADLYRSIRREEEARKVEAVLGTIESHQHH